MNKYELHAHTAECDRVAQHSGAEMVRLYADAGYSGMVITDHYFSLFYEWFKDEFCPSDHKSIIDRYLRGYHSARNEAERIGFSLLCGAEVRFDNTPNDYLIYGLEEDDLYTIPLLNRLKNLRELLAVLPDRAVVVQAHPFRDNMTVVSPDLLFGVEAHNGRTSPFRNKMARDYAEHYGKVMTSGSDFHKMKDLARGGIATPRTVTCSAELVELLKSGDYSLIGEQE
jgi:predicted metal-dependent phosphoesterase TrpH